MWVTIRAEMIPVWRKHNAEIAADDDKSDLDPDWQKFDQLAAKGEDHWITVRHHGVIVGYAFVIVTTHLHRRRKLCAFYDLYWLDPDYRKGTGAGARLLAFAEETLRARGAKKSYIGTKVWKNIGPLLRRMGYAETEVIYSKAL